MGAVACRRCSCRRLASRRARRARGDRGGRASWAAAAGGRRRGSGDALAWGRPRRWPARRGRGRRVRQPRCRPVGRTRRGRRGARRGARRPPARPSRAARAGGARDRPLGLGRWDHRPGRDARGRRCIPICRRRGGSRSRARAAFARGHARAGRSASAPSSSRSATTSPDDDMRQVNWRATERLGRPMSNQYRVERDRDVVCLVDCGRLMAAPLGERRGSTPRSMRPCRRGGRGRGGRPRRRRSRSTTRSAAASSPRRAGAGGGCRRRSSTSSRAGRLRLRARIPPRRRVEARLRARAHRPA